MNLKKIQQTRKETNPRRDKIFYYDPSDAKKVSFPNLKPSTK